MNDGRHLLQAVSRVSREWVNRHPIPGLQREALQHMGALAEDLMSDEHEHASLLAMAQLRALLCGHCRHLKPARNQCEQSLDQCPFLKVAADA